MKVYLSYDISSNSGNNRTKVILDKCKVSRWIWQCTLDFTGHQAGKAGRFVPFVLKVLAILKENHFGRVHWVVQLPPPVNPSGCPAGHSWHPIAALLSSHYDPAQRPRPHRSHWKGKRGLKNWVKNGVHSPSGITNMTEKWPRDNMSFRLFTNPVLISSFSNLYRRENVVTF